MCVHWFPKQTAKHKQNHTQSSFENKKIIILKKKKKCASKLKRETYTILANQNEASKKKENKKIQIQ